MKNKEKYSEKEKDDLIARFAQNFGMNINQEDQKTFKRSWKTLQSPLIELANVNREKIGVICVNDQCLKAGEESIKQKIIVVNRQSLESISNARVSAFYDNFEEETYEFTSDENGICELELPVYYDDNRFAMRISAQGYDELLTNLRRDTRLIKNQTEEAIQYGCLIFTDRNQYNPGDTVHILLWLLKESGESVHIASNQEFQIRFLNHKSELLGFQRDYTDDDGYFSWDLKLEPELEENDDYSLIINAIQEEKNKIVSTTREQIKIERYRRPEIKTSIEQLPSSWYCCDDLPVTIDAEYYYGDIVDEGTINIEVEDAFQNKEEYRFSISSGRAKIDIKGYSTENIPFHSGRAIIRIEISDVIGRKGDQKEIPIVLFTDPIALDIYPENLVLYEAEDDEKRYELHEDPSLVFETFDYFLEAAECCVKVRITDPYKQAEPQEFDAKTDLHTGKFRAPMVLTDRDLIIARWDRQLEIKVTNEKYQDSFTIKSMLNFKIKKISVRKDKIPATDTDNREKKHQISIKLLEENQDINQGGTYRFIISGTFEENDIIICNLYKNRIYEQKILRAINSSQEQVEFSLPESFTGKFYIQACYFTTRDGYYFEKSSEIFEIYPEKQLLSLKVDCPHSKGPGDHLDIELHVKDGNNDIVDDGIVSGVLVDKASQEKGNYEYPKLPEIFSFDSPEPNPKVIEPKMFPSRDHLKLCNELLKDLSRSGDYDLAFKILKAYEIKYGNNDERNEFIELLIRNMTTRASDNKKLFLAALNLHFQPAVYKELVRNIFPMSTYSFPLELKARLEYWQDTDEKKKGKLMMNYVCSSIVKSLFDSLIIESRLPDTWSSYMRHYGIRDQTAYHFLYLTDTERFFKLDRERISFLRERPIIEHLAASFKKNARELMDFLSLYARDSADKIEKIIRLIQEEPYLIIKRNPYVVGIIENRFVIFENGSRFIKYALSDWDGDRVEFADSLVGYPKYTSIMTDVDHYQRESYGSGDSRTELGGDLRPERQKHEGGKIEKIREIFDETGWWLPMQQFSNGNFKASLKLPDSITTQMLYMLVSDRKARIGDNLTEIMVKQDFFITAQLPEKIIHNDRLQFSIFITNLLPSRIRYSLSWSASHQLEIQGPDDKATDIEIEGNDSQDFEFTCEALKPGIANLTISADSDVFKDTVVHRMEILPHGIPIIERQVMRLTDEETSTDFRVSISNSDDAVKSFMTVIAHPSLDLVDTANEVLGYQYFCNEQTASMLSISGSLYGMLYDADQLTDELDQELYSILTKCVQKLIGNRNESKLWGWWKGGRVVDPFLSAYIHDSLIAVPYRQMPLLKRFSESVHKALYEILIDGRFKPDEHYGDLWDKKSVLRHTQKLPVLITELQIANSIIYGQQEGYNTTIANREEAEKLQHSLLIEINQMEINSETDPYLLYLIVRFFLLRDELEKSQCQNALSSLLELKKSGQTIGSIGIYWESDSLSFSKEYITAIIGSLLIDVGDHEESTQHVESFLRKQKENGELKNTTLDNAALFRFLNKVGEPSNSTFELHLSELKRDGKRSELHEWYFNPENSLETSFFQHKMALFRYPYDKRFSDEKSDDYTKPTNHMGPLDIEFEISARTEVDQRADNQNLNVQIIVETERWIDGRNESTSEDGEKHPPGIIIERKITSDSGNSPDKPTNLVKGQIIKIDLHISTNSEDTIDDIVIEEPISAGLTCQRDKLYEMKEKNACIDEILIEPDKITFIVSKLKEMDIKYDLIAIRKGVYTQKPANGYAMYNNQIRGRGKANKFVIN